ncbi:HAD family hydrolase [Halobium salinum]|uniref:HAD family hydrolase n=1 Tax=Halobium salinum TaxID=1364940 RepID=A0ABD5PGC6_9EURY|nr:HAD family phosphatase [Halobium salinum]
MSESGPEVRGEADQHDPLVAGAEAVLFDMDGVIVDSEAYWLAFEDEELFPNALAEPYPDNEEITGMNFREIYDYLDANYEVTTTREAFVERYHETARGIYADDVALMPGFVDLVSTLRERGLRVGIVSSSPPEWIQVVVDRFDLGPFDVVRSADAIDGPGKPEPDVYEHAAADLDADPARCVVVEDSATGSRAAERAGMVVVGYRTEVNAEADLPAADVVVDGPEALRTALLDGD